MARQIMNDTLDESDVDAPQALSEIDGDQIIEEINSLIYYNDKDVIEDNVRYIVKSLKLLSIDKNSSHRLKFLSFVKECIPHLDRHKDFFLLKLFSSVLSRICDRRMSTVRKAIRTAHLMFKSSKTVAQNLLEILIHQGIESKSLSMQTACVSRFSMILSYRLSHLDFSDLILSLLSKLDHQVFCQSQIRNALESLQEMIGSDNFRKNISRLSPPRQSKCYELLSGRDESRNSDSQDSYLESRQGSFFVQKVYNLERIVRGCYDSSFQVRLESLSEWRHFIEAQDSIDLSESELRTTFKHLFARSKEKSSRILESLLKIVSAFSARLVSPSKGAIHLFLEFILLEFPNGTEPLKILRYEALRNLNNRVSSPKKILEQLNLLIKDSTVSIKKEAIDFISYVILLNEKSEKLEIESVYKIVVVSVLNDNSSVRYAAMECLVILHSVAKRHRSSFKKLISTIQPAELISGGAGISDAFQTRLERNLVARINSKGLLAYGLHIPNTHHAGTEGPLKFLEGKDIDWILNSGKVGAPVHRPSYINKRRRLSYAVKSEKSLSDTKSEVKDSLNFLNDDGNKQLKQKPQAPLTDSELKFPVKPILARSAGNRMSQHFSTSHFEIQKFSEGSTNELSSLRNLRSSASRKMADRIFNDSGYMTVTDDHHRYEDSPGPLERTKTKSSMRNVTKRDRTFKKIKEERKTSPLKEEKVKDLVEVVDSINMNETAVEPLSSWNSLAQIRHPTAMSVCSPKKKKAFKPPLITNSFKTQQIKPPEIRKSEKINRLKTDVFEERISPSMPTGPKLCTKIIDLLQDSDWEKKCQGLNMVSSSLQGGKLTMDSHTQHTMLLSIIPEVKNLRSQVSRLAITCVSTMFSYLKTDLNPELDGITMALMNKSGESGQFLQQEVNATLLAMIENVTPQRALNSIIDCGARHKNAQTRKLASNFVLKLVEMMGPAKILEGARETILRVLPTISYFLCDNEPLTRYNARKMVNLLMEHPSFDKVYRKNMTVVSAKLISDCIETIAKKGMDEPPPETYSPRTKALDATTTSHTSDYYNNLKMKNDPVVLELDKVLNDIAVGDLRVRERAFTSLIEIATSSINAVVFYLKRIVDLLSAKLGEASTRSNLLALNACEQLLPLICEHMHDSLTKFLISAITRQLMSKNKELLHKTNVVLDIFQHHIGYSAMIISLVSNFANGTSLSKPLIVLRLSECISAMDSKKSREVSNHVLPLFWKLVDGCSSSGLTQGGVVSLREATAKLALSLQDYLGSSLIAAAKTNSNISPKNLKLLFELLES